MLEVDIEIEDMEKGCPAWESGNRYREHVNGKNFGGGGPAKDKKEIVDSIRSYIKSEEEWHEDKIKIKNFSNTTDLDITIADIKGEGKLSKWLE